MIINGVSWRLYQGALLPDAASHIDVSISKEQAREAMRTSGAYFIRYTDRWDSSPGEFWYVIKDHYGDIEELSSKTRNQVRKALKNCRIEKIDATELLNHGFELYQNAFSRYSGPLDTVDRSTFEREVGEGNRREYFAVYTAENKMIAYGVNKIYDDVCYYDAIRLHPDHLGLYPGYALIYTMNRYYLHEKKFKYVNDGARSISHETNVQDFLISKFKFRRAYCRLNIVYRWDVAIIVRCLYPFRKWVQYCSLALCKKLFALLTQEEIRRSFER